MKLYNIILIAVMSLFSLSIMAEDKEKKSYTAGWYLWDPYQYEKKQGDLTILTGLDVELVKEIGLLLDTEIKYDRVSWKQHQQDLKDGKRDFAAGATYTPERAEYVYFSVPYRYEENSLFVRRGEEGQLSFNNVAEFLDDIQKKSFRLGVIDGFIYADPEINKFINDERNKQLISPSEHDQENIKKLLNGKIDGFLSDRLVGATGIWRANKGSEINEIRLHIKTPIHLMFSKKTISQDTVGKFNEAIKRLKETNRYDQIISWYLHPVLLLQTVDSLWFRIIELIGTVAFAISGLAVAYRDRATVFGTLVFAMLPSLGGGVLRDVVFDRSPVRALEYPFYLLVVLGTVLLGFIVVRVMEQFRMTQYFTTTQNWTAHILAISDGLGLAAFTISGIVISVVTKVSPLWLWGPFFALLTGVGGGVMRDLLSKNRDIVALRGRIYPEIAVIWGLGLSLFLTYQTSTVETDQIRLAVIITVCGIFLTSIYVHFFKVPNLYFRGKASEEKLVG